MIDPTEPVLPGPDLCPAVIGDVLVYRNSGHITASFMATMRPWLERHPALRLQRPAGSQG